MIKEIIKLLLLFGLFVDARRLSTKEFKRASLVHSINLIDENGEDHHDAFWHPTNRRRLLDGRGRKFNLTINLNDKLNGRGLRRTSQEIITCNNLEPIGSSNAVASNVEITYHHANHVSKNVTAYQSNTVMAVDFSCVVTFAYYEGSDIIRLHGLRLNEVSRTMEDFEITDCPATADYEEGTTCLLTQTESGEKASCEYIPAEGEDISERRLAGGSTEHRHLSEAVEALPFELSLWENCYPGMENVHQMSIGISVGSELVSTLGGTGYVLPYVEALVSEVNVVYLQQLNVKLSVKAIDIVTESGAGSVSWDNPGCKYSVSEQHMSYRTTEKPSDQGVWQLLDNCWNYGTIGVAVRSSLCLGSNSGLSWVNPYGGTWLILAHEIGHQFGAAHSFEDGQGKTGGVMDYGDNLYRPGDPLNEYQFNEKYRYADMCTLLKSRTECKHWEILTAKEVMNLGTCGNGKLDDGEECECDGNKFECDCCKNCMLKSNAKCSPFGNDCCTDKCTYQPTSHMCSHSDGAGYCRNGHCAASRCTFVGRVDYCGVQSDDFPCRKMCESSSGSCSLMPSIVHNGQNLRYIRDGAFCQTSTVTYGQCQGGHCLNLEGGDENSPTPFPIVKPTENPTADPTPFPTAFPATGISPTPKLTESPTLFPTTKFPTAYPSNRPSMFPTQFPTGFPTNYPFAEETEFPSTFPTPSPTRTFSDTGNSPTPYPSSYPTSFPTQFPASNLNNSMHSSAMFCCETLKNLFGDNSFTYGIIQGTEGVCGGTFWAGKTCDTQEFSTAQSQCFDAGARLCTVPEILNGVASGPGCEFAESDMFWTTTNCNTEAGLRGNLAVSTSGEASECKMLETQAAVACCAEACENDGR